MKLHVLSKEPQQPCLVLQLKELTVMLDCSLDMSPLQHFLPLVQVPCERLNNLKPWNSAEISGLASSPSNFYEIAGRLFIDSTPEVGLPGPGILNLCNVDVILISNYHNMLALPYLTEYCDFNGKIYMTEPTLQIGRLLMEEVVNFHENCQRTKSSSIWKNRDIQKLLPYPLCDQADAASWKTFYSMHDVKSCVSKIQPIDYGEKLDVYGLIQVTGVSSGFCIGSCNWLLQTNFYKITYLSSSSVFSTHPQPLDQSSIKESDVLIMNSLTQAPTVNPDGMLREFCNTLAVTVKNNGNVLVPCYPTGVLYDLFEYLSSFMDGTGLALIPIYFISPVADSSLAHANIYAEWLCQSKQSKVYLPEAPFSHAELVKTGKLQHFPSLHGGLSSSFRTPCVVFAGHPSLRFGDVVHFIELWGKSSENTIIFIEPDFPYLEALRPFQPLAMKASYCPIDPRLNFSQANKLIKDLKPHHLVLPEICTKPPMLQPHRTDLAITTELTTSTYKHLDIINLNLAKSFEKVTLSNELATELCPKEIEAGTGVCSVKGVLVTRDNKHILHPQTTTRSFGSSTGNMLFGDVNVEQLVKALELHGIRGAQWDITDDGYIIHLPDADAVIQMQDGNTHIINHGSEELRIKIRDALLSCLLQV